MGVTRVAAGNEQGRFYLIDGLRGLAALFVVIFHYHHFYLADYDDRANLPATESFPWASLLQPAFDHGSNAVQLFWIISGFVFAHVYISRRTTLWSFGVARFARLYPLHFATLLFVAVLQIISVQTAGHWQIYGNNDLRHFGLHLLFSSDWSTQSRGLSYNGPIWSVSWEMVAYGLFFLSLALLRKLGILAAVVLIALSWWIARGPTLDLPLLSPAVFACVGYFFTGCAVYMLFIRLQSQPMVALGMAAALTILGLFVPIEDVRITALSAGLIWGLAIAEGRFARWGSYAAPLGDISYSLYLVHVPLQMCLLLLADVALGGTRGFAASPWLLPIYLVVSVVLAHLVYQRFERPVGRNIRTKLTKE